MLLCPGREWEWAMDNNYNDSEKDTDEMKDDIRYILSDERGRRFFFRLMERGRVFGMSGTMAHINPQQTAYLNDTARSLAPFK